MFKSIVVPVDMADLDLARLAIASAAKMAEAGETKLTLIHVVPVMPLVMLDTAPVSFEGEVAVKAKESLDDLVRGLDLPGISIQTVVRIGGIYHEVLSIAEEQHADLVVVGSHQPSVATYILGSNASAIVRHTTCSVLVVREEKAGELIEEEARAEEEQASTSQFPTVDEAMRQARETNSLH